MNNKECILCEVPSISRVCPYYDSDFEFDNLCCTNTGKCDLDWADIPKDIADKILKELAK